MAKQRQRRSALFKFQVALEALKEQKTLGQLASEYQVHPTQITQWKKQVLDGGTSLFGVDKQQWELGKIAQRGHLRRFGVVFALEENRLSA